MQKQWISPVCIESTRNTYMCIKTWNKISAGQLREIYDGANLLDLNM